MDQQGTLNAVAAGVLGLFAAGSLAGERGVAAIAALAKALIACVLAFGLHLGADVQSSLMVLVEVVSAGFLRTQVPARVDVGSGV